MDRDIGPQSPVPAVQVPATTPSNSTGLRTQDGYDILTKYYDNRISS